MSRLFFGLELSDDVRDACKRIQAELAQNGVEAGNWSDSSLFHLTVLFFGEIPPDVRDNATQAAKMAAAQVSPFTLRLSDVGVFARNRILWIGLSEDQGWERLSLLYKTFYREVRQRTDWPLEDRPYRPHMTLARKLNVGTWDKYQQERQTDLSLVVPPLYVKHLCLFESTRIDGKLQYPVLERFALTKPSAVD